jgi:hypothetical protein
VSVLYPGWSGAYLALAGAQSPAQWAPAMTRVLAPERLESDPKDGSSQETLTFLRYPSRARQPQVPPPAHFLGGFSHFRVPRASNWSLWVPLVPFSPC